MSYPHVQIEWNHWRIASVRPDNVLRIAPEEGAPRGRKGPLMADFWTHALRRDADGILWQDPDIVIDPDDMDEMRKAIDRAPDYIHCSVHKLWPASTMRDDWVYAHGLLDGIYHVLNQRMAPRADWFALGFTYTPARLLNLAAPHMINWVFGQVDSGLSTVARQNNIPAFPVPKCRPKHLHFYPREDDASWRPGAVSVPPAT
jgi:hypothetical protein